MSRTWKRIGSGAIALILLIPAVVVLLDANHLRGTLARLVAAETGRELAINGDLRWKFDWPHIHLHAVDVTFANPSWAREKQMIAAAAVDVDIDLPRLFAGTLFLTDVELDRPVVFFEVGAEDRKNWLLDREQKDEGARAWIGRLRLGNGRVSYDDPIRDTSIVVEISTRPATAGMSQAGSIDTGIAFKASGKYLGLPLVASGRGGPVLGLRDERTPFPMEVAGSAGPTTFRVEGTVAGVLDRRTVDANVDLRGKSLAELFDLLALPLPQTHAYSFSGHLAHTAEGWRYDKFSGRIGHSDVTGSLRYADGAARPLLQGEVAFKSLDLADLGPVVGKEAAGREQQTILRGRKVATPGATAESRALPARAFRRDRWTTVDADVQVKAQTIVRPKALPLEHLSARLQMRESVLTLDPLDVSAAGGNLVGTIRLDGQHEPIQAHARLGVRKVLLARLLPTVAHTQNSVGAINGEIELVGRGDSIARMLATADGKVGLVVEGGKISKLLMEQIAMHVPEIVLQKITGDELIDIRCGVADFNVEHGVMRVDALVLDTDVTRIAGAGSVDLAQETLNLTLVPKPKKLSLFALRGPISVQGDLAKPQFSVDSAEAGVRGLAAIALAAINPALSLVALVDRGSGKDSDCAALTHTTQAPWRKSVSVGKRAPA